MKTPTWGIVVGILMIFFGGCSTLWDAQAIYLPEKIEEEKEKLKAEMEEEREEAIDSVALTSADSATRAEAEQNVKEFEETRKKFEEFNIPDFTKTWMVRFGYIGMVSSVLYMAAGIFLLIKQRFSIKLAYAALIISLLCSGIYAAVLSSSSSTDTASGLVSMVTGISQIPGIIIDIILLSVVFASDKEAYQFNPLPPGNS
jgi:uncharacterized membrane protein (DUF485 family)